MTGADLRAYRELKRWNQEEAARRLGVTQGYLSLLESGRRRMSEELQAKLVALGGLAPVSLPLNDPARWLNVSDPNDELAKELGHLGYPGFSYHRGRSQVNPAELLVGALVQSKLEARLTDALPWLAATYSEMDWKWGVREAKVNDAQNRLGFVVALARQYAERKGEFQVAGTLNAVEKYLERSRLEREDTLCNDTLSHAERDWLKEHRPVDAAAWHLLTDLSLEQLSYAS
jgi:transcriptional regulator with XRE-family HTH domain